MSQSESIISGLRRRGYRITPQREMIVRAITQSEHHMSAEEILSELQETTQAINLATIYRTLELLWEEGYVFRNDLSEGKYAYAFAEHGPHIHLVCRKCKCVVDADPQLLQSLNRELLARHEFSADLEHFSVFGVCGACRRPESTGV